MRLGVLGEVHLHARLMHQQRAAGYRLGYEMSGAATKK